MNKRTIGTHYEERAARFLEKQGYLLVARNFRARQGEVDLVCTDPGKPGANLVFVEVKYRKNATSGHPEESITWRKQDRLRQAAAFFLVRYKMPADTPCRFDVIAIEGEHVRHIENAF